MISLRFTDRLALAAMAGATIAVALAATFTAPAAHAASKPSATLTLPDGGERRFYTTGPAGMQTFRVDVSPEGRVIAKRQVLTEDVLLQIAPGMKATEVFALIGPPYAKARFEATKTTVWDYHYSDPWSHDSDFSVIIDDAGIVAGHVTTRNNVQ